MERCQSVLAGLVVVALTLLAGPLSAIEAEGFEDPDKQKVYRELVDELRCLVCQNQNLADSNAELAQDLRREIRTMISDGDSKNSIVDFMVARYGEFVLYKPRFTANTLALWIGPFVFLLIGLLIVYRMARKSSTQPESVDSDERALQRARDLLQSDTAGNSERSTSRQ